MLVLIGAVLLTIRSFVIGQISQLGNEGVYYLATGEVPYGFVFFIYRQEQNRRNSFADKDNKKVKKVLTRTWDNRLDWWTFLVILSSAIGQALVFMSVILAFNKSRQAGLNIGISSAIWSIKPFLVSLCEKLFFAVGLKMYQLVGMLVLVVMAVLIAVSDIFGPNAKEIQIDETTEVRSPIYLAVLSSCLYPVIGTYMSMIIKYQDVHLRLGAQDFVQAEALTFGVIWAVFGFIHFQFNGGSFEFAYLI